MKSNKNKIEETFSYYPDHKELYVTFDGVVFLNKTNAQNHANVIGGDVETVKRDLTEPEKKAEDYSENAVPERKKKTKEI